MTERFDTILVGGGAAGCVLANRLSEDSSRTVLLLEAGPDYGPDPTNWPEELLDPSSIWPESHPWGYLHAGKPADAPLALPRARVMGGTTTINGSVWLRGSAADYDEWAALGNVGWSFADLLPYFQRAESDPLGGPLAGRDGPVPVYRASEEDYTPADCAYLDAVDSLGVPFVADLNRTAKQVAGIGPAPKNIADGIRMNGAFTYLAPARARSNLSIRPDSLVDRVVLRNGRATGVQLSDGTTVDGNEVVLCAGTYGSTAVLMRSGIGPEEHLSGLGIPVAVNLPGVGEHLLDHPLFAPDRLGPRLLRSEHAPDRRPFMPFIIKGQSRHAGDEIDFHIYMGQDFSVENDAWFFWISVSLQYARALGRVRLTSSDPEAPLDIDHAFLSDPADLEALCDGIDLAESVIAAAPMQGVFAAPQQPAPWGDRVNLPGWAAARVGTTYHPSSTCRMGPETDAMAVVDTTGRVYGADGLRVIDASIFPTSPRANVHFTVVAAAEKLAETME